MAVGEPEAGIREECSKPPPQPVRPAGASRASCRGPASRSKRISRPDGSDRARVVIEDLRALTEPLSCRWPRATLELGCARLAAEEGRGEDADRLFMSALEMHAELPMPIAHAEALLAHGTHLRRTGRPREAREPITAAAGAVRASQRRARDASGPRRAGRHGRQTASAGNRRLAVDSPGGAGRVARRGGNEQRADRRRATPLTQDGRPPSPTRVRQARYPFPTRSHPPRASTRIAIGRSPDANGPPGTYRALEDANGSTARAADGRPAATAPQEA